MSKNWCDICDHYVVDLENHREFTRPFEARFEKGDIWEPTCGNDYYPTILPEAGARSAAERFCKRLDRSLLSPPSSRTVWVRLKGNDSQGVQCVVEAHCTWTYSSKEG